MAADNASDKKAIAPEVGPKNEFASVALLLQGGGALGSYQAGVYEALAEADVAPDWVAGISIGAINGAIIAGNKPVDRVAKLKSFWQQVTELPPWRQFGPFNAWLGQAGTQANLFWNQMSAAMTMTAGAPGFFTPRIVPPWLAPEGSSGATSYYDTNLLKASLEKFIDFDILNSGKIRYTTSAVNVRTGNYELFENRQIRITPEHVMASGALPPALPAVEIDGQYFWDGGLISNTPLQWVMDDPDLDTLVFQVDLWSAEGEFPRNILEVQTREKEIRYSSRTRAVTDRFKQAQQMRHAFATLYELLPEDLKETKEAQLLQKYSDFNQYNIVHLIYRALDCEGYSKDFEFSRSTMEQHWKAGYNDTVRSLRHPEIYRYPKNETGIKTFDLSQD